MVGLDRLVGLSTGVRVGMVQEFFESSFCSSYILLMTAFALNHLNKVFRVGGDVVSNRSCFACGMECVRRKTVGARRTMATVLKIALRAGGGGGVCCLSGLHNLARRLLSLFLRREATIGGCNHVSKGIS